MPPPKAWIVNYSNPAAIVAEVYVVYVLMLRVLNICDMPVAMINGSRIKR